MSEHAQYSKDAQCLIEQFINQNISAEGIAQLGRYLEEDDDLLTMFRDACQLHIDLETEICSERAIDRTIEFIDQVELVQVSSRLGIASATRRRSTSYLLATTACLLLVALAAWVSRRTPVVAVNADPAPRRTEAAHNLISVRLANAESRVLPIGDVGTVSIQGPALFELVGNMRARLHYGRIKVRISDERGHGFVVETPRGEVTDLGTEFGVDVGDDSDTGVVVFEGIVDLALHPEKHRTIPRVERLVQGQGLSLGEAGRTHRIMSIVTGNVATFQRRGEARQNDTCAVIGDVWDNIRTAEFKMFYEIVPGGLKEDALTYADRPHHNWNGVTAQGMPRYLIGADYVKPFNSDKMRRDVQISVSLTVPARLFLLFDDRVSPPDWLQESFRDTGDDIGLDCGPFSSGGDTFWFGDAGTGPGNSLDANFSVWERTIDHAGVVQLGPNLGASNVSGMYAIAAVPLGNGGSQHGQKRTNASQK